MQHALWLPIRGIRKIEIRADGVVKHQRRAPSCSEGAKLKREDRYAGATF